MKVQILQNADAQRLLEMPSFRGKWNALWGRCPWATPFQRPGFAMTWYRCYGSRFRPLLAVARAEDGGLTGLLPLAISRQNRRAIVTGDRQAEYQTWIREPDLAETFPWRVLRAFREHVPGVTLTFQYLPAETPMGWLAEPEPRRRCMLRPYERPLPQVGDTEMIVKWRRKKHNRGRLNRLKRTGPLEFKRIADPEEFAGVFDQIIGFCGLRQAAAHRVVPFRDDDLKRLFDLEMMQDPNLLHVTVLKAGDVIAAAHVGARGGRQPPLSVIAHNPFLARESPGTFLIAFLRELLRGKGLADARGPTPRGLPVLLRDRREAEYRSARLGPPRRGGRPPQLRDGRGVAVAPAVPVHRAETGRERHARVRARGERPFAPLRMAQPRAEEVLPATVGNGDRAAIELGAPARFPHVPASPREGPLHGPLRAALRDAAQVPGIGRVYAAVPGDDSISRHVVEKLGFTQEGSIVRQRTTGSASDETMP